MKLKNLCYLFFPFLLLLWLAPMNVVFAFYTKGDTLYVLARKGLNMRVMPNIRATLIQELAYGTPLIIANDSIFDAYQVEDIKDFYIQGNWVKACDNNKTCGYVFDGYLSKFVAPPIEYKVPDNEQPLGIIGYYFKHFLKLKPQIIPLKKAKDCKKETYSTYCVYSYKVNLGDNITYNVDLVEYGISEKFIFKKISLKDIYLLSKIWLLHNRISYMGLPMYIYFCKSNDEIIFSTGEGTGCDYTLKQEAGKIILDGGCGC